MSADEEPHHSGFYTLGLFTSRQRALACIQSRGMTAGALSILPVSINEPLSPGPSTGNLTAYETRQMVCHRPTLSPVKQVWHPLHELSNAWNYSTTMDLSPP